jgi:hypothetical protein
MLFDPFGVTNTRRAQVAAVVITPKGWNILARVAQRTLGHQTPIEFALKGHNNWPRRDQGANRARRCAGSSGQASAGRANRRRRTRATAS